MDEMVTISREEYTNLRDDSRLLRCLENAGVDNWEWYGDALEEFQEESIV